MKITLIVPAAALLLAGCATSTPGGEPASTTTTASASSVQEERYVPLGTYLPRKRGQTANNSGTVDKTDLENMQNAGKGTGAMSSGLAR